MQMVRAVASLGFVELYATPTSARHVHARARGDRGGVRRRRPPTSPRRGRRTPRAWARRTSGTTCCTAGCASTPSRPTATGPRSCSRCTRSSCPRGSRTSCSSCVSRGMLPVMAHPERYAAIQRDVDLAERLGRHAVLMVDLGALDGAHGRAEMKTARKLVQEGLAHAAATDIHRPDDRKGSPRAWPGSASSSGPEVLDQMLGGEHAPRCWPARCRTRRARLERVACATSAPPAARPLRRSRLP